MGQFFLTLHALDTMLYKLDAGNIHCAAFKLIWSPYLFPLSLIFSIIVVMTACP